MKRLLIVTDYQKDKVVGAVGFEAAVGIDEKICSLIEEYRRNENEIVYTLDTHDEEYENTPEGKFCPTPHCVVNTEGWQLYGNTAYALTTFDTVFIKPTHGSLELGNYLKENGYEAVDICGLTAHGSVLSNAVIARAALPYAEITVNAAAVEDSDNALKNKAFDILQALNINVVNRGN